MCVCVCVCVLKAHGFDLYLNGHTHCLTQYTVDGSGAYVTSGAGALVLSYDQERGTVAKNRTHDKVSGVIPHGFSAMRELSFYVSFTCLIYISHAKSLI